MKTAEEIQADLEAALRRDFSERREEGETLRTVRAAAEERLGRLLGREVEVRAEPDPDPTKIALTYTVTPEEARRLREVGFL